MPIDPNIALQVQPPKFDSPVNMLTQVMQMQGLRDQNSLNALKMQEYQREGEERNAFRNALSADFDPSNPGQVNALMRASPKMATDYLKSVYERQKTQAEIEKSRAETRDRGLKTLGLALSSTLEDPSDNSLRRAFDSLDAVGIDTQKIRTHFAGVPDVEARRQLIRGFAFNSPEGKAAIEFVQPKWEKQTDNQKTWFVDTNPNSRTFGTKRDEFQMQATPGDVLQADTAGKDRAARAEQGDLNRGVQIRAQNISDARAREANANSREAAQTQVVVDPNRGPILVNKQTGIARPAIDQTTGQPVQGENAAKKEAAARSVMPLLDEADKLVGKATGSGVGAIADSGAALVGIGTPGARATARLRVLEGQLIAGQPRMEGPQSDKDVLLYRQMAGQIGDPAVPASIKREALKTIREITTRYANLSPGQPNQPGQQPSSKVVDFGSLK